MDWQLWCCLRKRFNWWGLWLMGECGWQCAGSMGDPCCWMGLSLSSATCSGADNGLLQMQHFSSLCNVDSQSRRRFAYGVQSVNKRREANKEFRRQRYVELWKKVSEKRHQGAGRERNRENKKGDRERQNGTKHRNRTPLELWSTISDPNMTIKWDETLSLKYSHSFRSWSTR